MERSVIVSQACNNEAESFSNDDVCGTSNVDDMAATVPSSKGYIARTAFSPVRDGNLNDASKYVRTERLQTLACLIVSITDFSLGQV